MISPAELAGLRSGLHALAQIGERQIQEAHADDGHHHLHGAGADHSHD